jgi:DNA-binding GntR family transcriptional regulator
MGSPLSTTARVMDEIRNLIVTGDLLPGQSLQQAALAERLSVSRAPVREALKGLEIESVVTHRHNVGYVVARMSARDLEQIYIMRNLIENELLETLEPPTEEVLTHLRDLNKQLWQAAQGPEVVRMTQLNREFHMTILSLSRLSLIVEEARRFWARSEAYRSVYLQDEGARERIVSEHDEMICSLQDGDVEHLKQLTLDHRTNSEQYVAQFLGGQTESDGQTRILTGSRQQ